MNHQRRNYPQMLHSIPFLFIFIGEMTQTQVLDGYCVHAVYSAHFSLFTQSETLNEVAQHADLC